MYALDQTTSSPFVFLQSVETGAKKTGRAKVGRTKAVVWAKGEKKGTTDKASAFDLCVASTTQKCDQLMLESSRQDKENNWIAVNQI